MSDNLSTAQKYWVVEPNKRYFIQGLSKERNKTESNKLFFIYVYYQLPQARVVNSNYLYLLEGSKH